MYLHLRKFFVILVTLLVSNQLFAAEDSEVSAEQRPIQWVRYLSDADKADIASRLAVEEYRRREAGGTFYEKAQQQEVSFPVSFIPPTSTSDSTSRAAAASGGGNVTCNINTQFPHAGSGPGGSRVVKAKSSGSCQYIHGYGTPPPWVKWDLTQSLVGILGTWPNVTVTTETAVHTRTSLNPVWSASSAQVFSPNCINGPYSHYDQVFITPPPGWTYTGPQPIAVPSGAGIDVNNC